MVQRTVAFCDGKHIGIESVYTVINGQQINIPEKLKELRAKGQNNELFCPCGCGYNLILVAGDKNLRKQHFRLKNGAYNQECHVTTEGKISVDSKIVLKCWLDDKLKTTDIESRVPIQAVDDIDRKYEFTFLSRDKKIALSYCRKRENLSDEKIDLMENNKLGIRIIYVVDIMNSGSDGQYPEWLMKIQNKQGYCLLLSVNEADYGSATMKAVFYAMNINRLWQEVSFACGQLIEFSIDDAGKVIFAGNTLDVMKLDAEKQFKQNIKAEKERLRLAEETAKHRAEIEKKRRLEEEQRKAEIEEKHRLKEEQRKAEIKEKNRLEEERRQAEIQRRDEDFRLNIESNFTQQETQVRDAEGNRWIKCEFCEKIDKDGKFNSYGGEGRLNLGTCKECSKKNPAIHIKLERMLSSKKSKYDPNTCPECGDNLLERSGPYGKFMGCSNYPECRYTRKL